jgi:hypothetical protein
MRRSMTREEFFAGEPQGDSRNRGLISMTQLRYRDGGRRFAVAESILSLGDRHKIERANFQRALVSHIRR